MLYERWRAIASAGGDETALRDLADNRSWTFRQLARAAETTPCPDPEPWCRPRGARAEFILGVLAGWREGRVVVPLDADQAAPEVPPPPRSAVHYKLTSGTTGGSRGIWFTAGQLAADADNIVATMGLRPEWPNLAAISLAHSYGFSNLVLPLLLHGIPLCLAAAPLPEPVRKAGREMNHLTLPGVPALWRSWHEADAIPPGTRLAISAGAPLPVALERTVFERRGIRIRNFYGASECGAIAFDSNDPPRSSETYAGAPVRNVELTLDPDGCLLVRSRATGSGYWPEEDPSLRHPHFLTSDYAALTPEGVHLLGRATDTINLAGRKVQPAEIETVLRSWERVRDCIVFGAPDPSGRRGDIILAWVVPEGRVSEADLRWFAQERLAPWQQPHRWLIRDALPVNERGKASRAALRRQFTEA